MRFAKSLTHGIFGVILLVLIIAAGMVVCDERCSRLADWGEEGFEQNVPSGGER